MALRRYDPTKITVVFGGHLVSGFGDDTFISIEFDEDSWGKAIGVQGEGTRYRIANEGAQVMMTLQHSSPSNDVFMAAWQADKESNTGALPFVMRDEYGTSIYSSTAIWVKKRPTFERGRAVSNVTWTFDCIAMQGFVGSNA